MVSPFESILQYYGLSEKQAKVYLAVLQLENAGASEIARLADVNRASVYAIIESLIAENILFETENRGLKYFNAISPQQLFDQFEKRYEDFQRQLPEFVNFANLYARKPKVQFFEGKQGVDDMLYKYTHVRYESMCATDHVWRGYNDATFLSSYYDRLKRCRKLQTEQYPGVALNLLTNPSPFENQLAEDPNTPSYRKMHILNEHIDFVTMSRVCGDYIIMIVTDGPSPYAFQIYDKLLASTFRQMFGVLYHKFSHPYKALQDEEK